MTGNGMGAALPWPVRKRRIVVSGTDVSTPPNGGFDPLP
jgi:hypothetical protein